MDHKPLASPTTGIGASPRPGKRRWWRFAPIVLVAAGLGIGYACGWQGYLSLDYLYTSGNALKAYVAAKPLLAGGMFFVLYAAAVAFSFPAASVLTVFAGFLFGWIAGGILVAFAATVGATAIFLAARSAFGSFLRGRVGSRVERLAQGFERSAFGYLLALRLAPVFPFFIVNIAPAFFNVRWRTFVGATFLGILPGTFVYAYLGSGIGTVLAAAQRAGGHPRLSSLVSPTIVAAFVALALLAAVPALVRSIRGTKS